MMFKVLVCDNIDKEGLHLLDLNENVSVDYCSKTLSGDGLVEKLIGYHGVLVRSATKLTAEVISRLSSVLVIGRAGVGVDNIDVDAATKKGIYVCNSPYGNIVAAAEHTCAMIFATCRNVVSAGISLQYDKAWRRNEFVGSELKGRTLGVLGCGRVGSQVIRVMQAVGMKVMVYDPYLNSQTVEGMGAVKCDTLEEVFTKAKVITLHLPLTKVTRGLIDRKYLSLMERGIIVNVSRGGVIDEDDLLNCIRGGSISRAALDVFAQEPLSENSPLLDSEFRGRLLVTPHLGGSTEEAQLQVAIDVARQICEVASGSVPEWALNKSSLINTQNDEGLFMSSCMERLAYIVAQLCDNGGGSVEEISVIVDGDDAIKRANSSSLIPYAACGVMKAQGVEYCNIVNIEHLCEERCVKLSFQDKMGVPQAEFGVRITTSEMTVCGVGAYSNRVPDTLILRNLNGVPCHVMLPLNSCGRLVVTKHINQPGLLGIIASKIGLAGKNIEHCSVARVPDSSYAMALLLISDELTAEEQANIKELVYLEEVLEFYSLELPSLIGRSR